MLNSHETNLVLELTAGLPESEILKAIQSQVAEVQGNLSNYQAVLNRNGFYVVDWSEDDAIQAQVAIEAYNRWNHILSSVAMEGFHRPTKMIDAFSPTEQDKEEIARIRETGEYKFRCWLPESVMGVGDLWIYFNGLEDVEPEWLRKAIDSHIVESVQTGDRVMSLYK